MRSDPVSLRIVQDERSHQAADVRAAATDAAEI